MNPIDEVERLEEHDATEHMRSIHLRLEECWRELTHADDFLTNERERLLNMQAGPEVDDATAAQLNAELDYACRRYIERLQAYRAAVHWGSNKALDLRWFPTVEKPKGE